jgi:glycosyltransferase involved in cell wall biosynthesis
LGAIPSENLAARLILREQTGLLADPVDPVSLADAAETLVGSPRLRAEMGARARAYADSAFKIDLVADRFEHVIGRVLSHENTH